MIALIISLPIIFFIIIISLRCLRLLIWCYRPICRHCSSSSFRFISLTSYLFSKVNQLFSRNKLNNAGQQPEVKNTLQFVVARRSSGKGVLTGLG